MWDDSVQILQKTRRTWKCSHTRYPNRLEAYTSNFANNRGSFFISYLQNFQVRHYQITRYSSDCIYVYVFALI